MARRNSIDEFNRLRRIPNAAMPLSPTDERRRELPRGNGDWAGYETVYRRIAGACERMARTKYVYLSDEHINAMAVLGCGHEETMKYELARLMGRGFIEL